MVYNKYIKDNKKVVMCLAAMLSMGAVLGTGDMPVAGAPATRVPLQGLESADQSRVMKSLRHHYRPGALSSSAVPACPTGHFASMVDGLEALDQGSASPHPFCASFLPPCPAAEHDHAACALGRSGIEHSHPPLGEWEELVQAAESADMPQSCKTSAPKLDPKTSEYQFMKLAESLGVEIRPENMEDLFGLTIEETIEKLSQADQEQISFVVGLLSNTYQGLRPDLRVDELNKILKRLKSQSEFIFAKNPQGKYLRANTSMFRMYMALFYKTEEMIAEREAADAELAEAKSRENTHMWGLFAQNLLRHPQSIKMYSLEAPRANLAATRKYERFAKGLFVLKQEKAQLEARQMGLEKLEQKIHAVNERREKFERTLQNAIESLNAEEIKLKAKRGAILEEIEQARRMA